MSEKAEKIWIAIGGMAFLSIMPAILIAYSTGVTWPIAVIVVVGVVCIAALS